jgi:galactonate dehydratase
VHTRLDPADATTLCRELKPTRPYFVEDALRCENPKAYTSLRQRSTVPLAAGEQFTSMFEFRPLIEDDLIDYARVDVANTGLTDARKSAAMAEVHPALGVDARAPFADPAARHCGSTPLQGINVRRMR